MREILFKDVAHLYANSLFRYSNEFGNFQARISERIHKGLSDGKPILRPLSDMTDEEAKEIVLLKYNVRNTLQKAELSGRHILFTCSPGSLLKPQGGQFDVLESGPHILTYLISRHFDLFGLIESGQAIDATTLPVNPYKG